MLKKKIKKINKKSQKFIYVTFVSLVLLIVIFFVYSYKINILPIDQFYINQLSQTDQEFISKIKDKAIQLNKKYQVPASIIIAQASLESNFGRSDLASQYGNLFGIKAGPFEKKVKLPTKEYINNEWVTKNEYFKVYDNWNQSLEDHTKLITNGTSWNKNQYHKVVKAKNYKEAAYAMQQSGYATDPNYAEKLIKVIDDYQLYNYDIYK